MKDIDPRDRIILTVKAAINNNSTKSSKDDEFIEMDSNDVDHVAEEVAERLLADGWRKSPCAQIVGESVVCKREIQLLLRLAEAVERAESAENKLKRYDDKRQRYFAEETVREIDRRTR